ncbi:hypothetical protein C6501_08845 [Candidatus Poribacteria bacterium]|nr:MAG: hypothetical protein C6501_08845 [Candidatus Poribacteria bacterium]
MRNSNPPVNGEKFGEGTWIGKLYPVNHDGTSSHMTSVTINAGGKVSRAFSNSCRGIIYAPGHIRSGADGGYWCHWDRVSHFKDAVGNRYEKETQYSKVS